MYYVYILKSISSKRYYVGQTYNLTNRLFLHNQGHVKSTRNFRPWEIIYSENHNTREDAILREKYLKSHAGRNYIKKIMGD